MKAHLGRLPGEGSLGGQVKALLGEKICEVRFGQGK
jgi:hypothetical protein